MQQITGEVFVKVFVERTDDGTFWGTTQNLPGVVTAFGQTIDELKSNLKVAVDDYLEVGIELAEPWVDEVKAVKGFEFKMDISWFFDLVPYLKIGSIAGRAKINPSLMRQYATGKANASESRLKQIEKAINELGTELSSVSF
ncbi:type II toxin-antitoxin system HicB family antitoxin [Muricauda sp. SCSIO 64092]|uniref:type II toxin-antitoxin system HicB family antitoxin n=1 Tax=Allomuricauda sp. SCSIO 64092 TaxID=2908842 RepID=UPI001FF59FE7|nr:type II toxin-antitoxin system HicB family antitoxin [Muricauda sp. SCSIO 64092]UOY07727.1 type II toxin-antitoxin system HicB family antitoxin [Muricauda sp. SCSIO 64092]